MNQYILPIASIIISVGSVAYTVYRGRLDNSRLIVIAEFHAPNKFTIIAQNYGRRKVVVNDIEAVFNDGKKTRLRLSNLGGTPLGELESFLIPQPETYGLLNSGNAIKLFVFDSTGKKYYVRNSKRCLKEYYPSAKKSRLSLLTRMTGRENQKQ